MQAHEHAPPPDHSIVNQMQLLHCAHAMAQPGYYTSLHLAGQSQGRNRSWLCRFSSNCTKFCLSCVVTARGHECRLAMAVRLRILKTLVQAHWPHRTHATQHQVQAGTEATMTAQQSPKHTYMPVLEPGWSVQAWPHSRRTSSSIPRPGQPRLTTAAALPGPLPHPPRSSLPRWGNWTGLEVWLGGPWVQGV